MIFSGRGCSRGTHFGKDATGGSCLMHRVTGLAKDKIEIGFFHKLNGSLLIPFHICPRHLNYA